MKILHIGLCVDGKNEGLPYALKKASTKYHEMKPQPHAVLNHVREFAKKEKWDLAFFQIQAENVIEPEVFRILKEAGTFTLNWSGDIRRNTERWYFETGADLTCFSNMRDIQALRSAGIQADFLQIGIDPKVFNLHGIEKHHYKHDIVFMGNNYGGQFPLGRERNELVNRIRRMGGAVYGGYQGAIGNLNGNQLEESICYNNSKIAINHSHFNVEAYTSDRLFRILGSGCFCLSHHYQGIEQDFQVGNHLATYTDLNDMQRKIDYYLKHNDEREEIAMSGYELCHKKHRYKQMVQNIIKLYEHYK